MLPKTINELSTLLDNLMTKALVSEQSKIYFVDDGSRDKTWEILKSSAESSPLITAIRLSCNKGHQQALYAGLCSTTEDVVVSIDADLQDGPENIETMLVEYQKGNDVVYGVRAERKTDSFFKRFTAEGYYHLMRRMGVDLVFNHADFRLLSRKALDSLLEYHESNLFLRGIIRNVGFQSAIVEYDRQAREAGESKYPLRKMLSLAWNGITSFSSVPLRMITLLGILSSIVSFLIILWVLSIRLFTDTSVPGWASILLPLLFIGSVQLLSLGIIGEYIAKIYAETKQRPKYHISEIVRKS
jgi:glycosyltransferase involved in cell wall biosynthesis